LGDAQSNLLPIIIAVSAVGLIPFAVVTMTAFLKIAIVLFLVRNALGTQQTPPDLVLYAIAVVLTIYVSAPLIAQIGARLTAPGVNLNTPDGLRAAAEDIGAPLRDFLSRFAAQRERDFLLSAVQQVWPQQASANVSANDLVILIPAFVTSELTRAFEIGFLLYLPFIAIDLIVANVLMAMGMVMVSPLVISTPFKLFLFVLVSGWTRLLHGLVLSYAR
jgi:type III secretion protein R